MIIANLLVFLLCGFIHITKYEINTTSIAITLISLILCTIPGIIDNFVITDKIKHYILEILNSIYLIVSLTMPQMHIFLPLLLINATAYNLYVSLVLSCICLIYSFLFGDIIYSIFILLLCTITVVMQYYINKNATLSEQLRTLRDTSKEHELLVEEKNRSLREHQDSQIYMATLKERNRIAREIHDNVGHMLTRALLQIGAIKTINNAPTLSEPLDGLHETLNSAMTSIRSSVHDLHDESIDLKSAITEITHSVTKFSIDLNYDMGYDVPKEIKYCFISIIKEAVNNSIKHSNATNMDIIVREHPAFYQLFISDNGTNAAKNHNSSGINRGIGLTNMEDRIKNLHGNIKITSDNGFKITISIIK